MVKMIFIYSALCLLCACNYSLWVPKSNVISEERGFLLFYYPDHESIFYPWKGHSDTAFLSKSHFNGRRLREEECDYLRASAVPYVISSHIVSGSMDTVFRDTLLLMPVTVRSYWDKALWYLHKSKYENIRLEFEIDGSVKRFDYQEYDDRSTMSVNPQKPPKK